MVKIKDKDFQIIHNEGVSDFEDPPLPCFDVDCSCEGIEKSDIRIQVEEFMEAAGYEVLDKPQVPSEEIIELRLGLVVEEVKELVDACGENITRVSQNWIDIDRETVNLEAVADALADIDYVVEGMRLAMGINGLPIAREVHRANMTKFAVEVQIYDIGGSTSPSWFYQDPNVEESVGPFKTRKEAEEHALEGGYVFKREDGKHLKPRNWQPPDIAGELKKQGWKE